MIFSKLFRIYAFRKFIITIIKGSEKYLYGKKYCFKLNNKFIVRYINIIVILDKYMIMYLTNAINIIY